jgi:hypothetical protein
MIRRATLSTGLAAAVSAACLLLTGTAAAATPPDQTCQANPVRVSLLGTSLAPFSANPGPGPCATDDATVLKTTTLGPLTITGLASRTVASPGAAFASTFLLPIGLVLPGMTLSTAEIDSLVQTRCYFPTNAASRVVGLTINGKSITIPNNDAPMHISLGGLGFIDLNQVTVTPDGGGTARAVYIHTLLADVVLGESIATSNRAGCGTTPAP